MRTQTFGEQVAARVGGSVSAGEVLGAISPRFVPSQFFDIYATHQDPAIAQILANVVPTP